MPHVHFTPNLRRHVECPTTETAGGTVREALENVFAERPQLRGYIVDDQHQLRQHVIIFIDGRPIVDRTSLSDPVKADAEIYVMQALSGG